MDRDAYRDSDERDDYEEAIEGRVIKGALGPGADLVLPALKPGKFVDGRRRPRSKEEIGDEETIREEDIKAEKDAPARRGALENGWVKHKLMHELAVGELNGSELGEKYGVSRMAISKFKQRHWLEITRIREEKAGEYAGLWVANKLERLREYQDAAEKMASGVTPRSAEVLVTILKAVAEELGDLPARSQVNVQMNQVEYKISGVNLDDLS